MNEIEKLLNIALSEEGYLEKKTNNDLDSKTENAGFNNFTKYARDLDNISGFYNGKKNGYPWCDVFVDWCFVKAFGVKRAKELLCQPDRSLGAGCSYSAKYFKDNNQFYKNSPKDGDQIFFNNFAHTGLVYRVDSSHVYTIEGNTSSTSGVVSNGGCVCCKKYPLNASYIDGYGRPKYKSEETKKGYTGTFPILPTRDYFYYDSKRKRIVDKGEQVKNLQRLLNWILAGDLEIDGKFGPLCEKATRKFQKMYSLTYDGCFGKECLKKAKEIKK